MLRQAEQCFLAALGGGSQGHGAATEDDALDNDGNVLGGSVEVEREPAVVLTAFDPLYGRAQQHKHGVLSVFTRELVELQVQC
ncbi:hypothetical protein L596_025444 [Steinernema carpocapsae]|uniref:Uncharacterized protein n=1 Tax=Steinernema carpocapsae TaxID=34508 RepID=A0A4U5M7S8_STECR|nr:hypothetical protein L596_025444 [Steinernema carpocapsae]